MEVDLSGLERRPEQETGIETPDTDYDEIPLPDPEEEPEADEKFGQDRKRLLLLIEFHINEFPVKLANYKKVKLEKQSNKELQKLLEEMQFTLGATSNVRAGVQAMCFSIKIFEDLAVTFTPLKIKGLSGVCNDPEVIDDMKAICLKHMNLMHVEPEARLGLRLMTTAMALHNMNDALEAKKTADVTDVRTNEVSAKYPDL